MLTAQIASHIGTVTRSPSGVTRHSLEQSRQDGLKAEQPQQSTVTATAVNASNE